jgi:AbrB family looped-hinge helix DNA binding protein
VHFPPVSGRLPFPVQRSQFSRLSRQVFTAARISDILKSGDSEMQTVLIGKRGTVVIPAKTRKRYRLDEGTPMLIEEREDGILMRPAVTTPVEVEVYTPERLAEFFLNNVLTKAGYMEARGDVERMGIDPDSIDHIRWHE